MSRVASFRQDVGTTLSASGRFAPAAIAVLIGVGFALLLSGFLQHFYGQLDPSPLTFRLVVTAVLAAAALGPVLIEGSALRLARAARNRMTRHTEQPADGTAAVDRDLLWVATGFAGLTAGVAALLLPWMLETTGAACEWAYRTFFWTDTSLTMLEALAVFAAALVPFALVGFFLRCAHQLSCPRDCWDFSALIGALFGVAIGFSITGQWQSSAPPGVVLICAGAFPLLLAAIISVAKASPAVRRRRPSTWSPIVDEPDLSERWPMVLRLALAVCVVGALTTGLVWSYVVAASRLGGRAEQYFGAGVLIFCLALGMLRALRVPGDTDHSIFAVGRQLAITGLAVAASAAVFNLVMRQTCAPFFGSLGHWLLWGVCAAGSVGAAGHATGFGIVAVFRRGSYTAASGVRLLGLLVISAAFAMGFVALPLLSRLGSYASLVAMALLLLATGGILLIHEPRRADHHGHAPLIGLFAAVAFMMWLMPYAGKGWLGYGNRRAGQLVESWWHTRDVVGRSPSSAALGPLDWRALPPGWRVATISLLDRMTDAPPADFAGRVERWLIDPQLTRQAQHVPAQSHEDSPLAPRSMSALRTLRTARSRYDVIAVIMPDASASLLDAVMTPKTVRRLGDRLAPDALLVFVTPNSRQLAERVWPAFAAGGSQTGPRIGWVDSVSDGSSPAVYVLATSASAWAGAQQWSQGRLAAMNPVLSSPPAGPSFPPAPHGNHPAPMMATR